MMPYEKKETDPNGLLKKHLMDQLQKDMEKTLGREAYREYQKRFCPSCGRPFNK